MKLSFKKKRRSSIWKYMEQRQFLKCTLVHLVELQALSWVGVIFSFGSLDVFPRWRARPDESHRTHSLTCWKAFPENTEAVTAKDYGCTSLLMQTQCRLEMLTNLPKPTENYLYEETLGSPLWNEKWNHAFIHILLLFPLWPVCSLKGNSFEVRQHLCSEDPPISSDS